MGTVHSMKAGLASDRSLRAAAADNAFLAISTESKEKRESLKGGKKNSLRLRDPASWPRGRVRAT